MENNYIILNPDYYFKNDNNRIILLSKSNVNLISDKNWASFIHPLQAIILSFFTKSRKLSETIEKISQSLDIKREVIERFIIPYIENETPVYTLHMNKKVPFPKNLLIYEKDCYSKKHPQENINIINLYCEKDIDLFSKRINTSPLDITIMLTNKCVTSCIYCYADIKKKCDKGASDRKDYICNK